MDFDKDINSDEPEDRISQLPDSLIHYILSFLETKCVATTSVLSKRWSDIWASIPNLNFRFSWNYPEPTSISEINKFMNFVDRTLLLHYASSIQKFSLTTNRHMNASQVHSWISSITKRNLEQLFLYLDLSEPFSVPVSLFTCQSLTELVLLLGESCTIHLPKSFSFPKLKSLILRKFRFTNDNCWDEQLFSNCPVIEELSLEECTWSDVRNFCISSPALKHLKIEAFANADSQDCALKINAPNLLSLAYLGGVPKEFILSSFQKLESAEVFFDEYGAAREQLLSHCAAASKLLRALSHIQSLETNAVALEVLFDPDNYPPPTFHNLNKFDLVIGPATDKLIFALLKAAPNLMRLGFYEDSLIDDDEEDDEEEYDEEQEYDEEEYGKIEGLFRHLQSVYLGTFVGGNKELRWAEFILKEAKILQLMTIQIRHGENKEIIISELSSLPRASERCVIEFV